MRRSWRINRLHAAARGLAVVVTVRVRGDAPSRARLARASDVCLAPRGRVDRGRVREGRTPEFVAPQRARLDQ